MTSYASPEGDATIVADTAASASPRSTPSARPMRIESTRPFVPRNEFAVAGSNALTLAPPPPSVLFVPVRPTRVNSPLPLGPTIGTVSPITYPARSADFLSIATSPAPRASRPSSTRRPSRPSVPYHAIPNEGPDVCSGLPFFLMIVAWRRMLTSTVSTPGTDLIPATSESGTGSRCAVASSPKAIFVRTSRSTSPCSSAKRPLMAPFTLSVSMNAPDTKATPRMIAKAVSSTRNLRARTPRTVSRRTGDAIASGQALHSVEHPLGRRFADLVDNLAVGEEDDTVGVRRRIRVVGDHHDRLAELGDGPTHEAENV